MKRTTQDPRTRLSFALATAAAAWLASSSIQAQNSSGEELAAQLSRGGHVVVTRHATSPMEPPPPQRRAPANVDGERQLDEDGQAQMTAMGYAFRELNLPVGQTLTSPAYRAVESAEYFGFGEIVEVDELAPPADGGDPAWLASNVAQAPAEGRNRVVVTHRANIVEAFGDEHGIETLEDGESLIFRPAGGGTAELVGRMTIRDWAVTAVN